MLMLLKGDWFRMALLSQPVKKRPELVIEHPDLCYYHGFRYPPGEKKKQKTIKRTAPSILSWRV